MYFLLNLNVYYSKTRTRSKFSTFAGSCPAHQLWCAGWCFRWVGARARWASRSTAAPARDACASLGYCAFVDPFPLPVLLLLHPEAYCPLPHHVRVFMNLGILEVVVPILDDV